MTTARLNQRLLGSHCAHDTYVSFEEQNNCNTQTSVQPSSASSYLDEVLTIQKILLYISELQTIENMVLELALHTHLVSDRSEHLSKMNRMLSNLIDAKWLQPTATLKEVELLKNDLETRLQEILSTAKKTSTPGSLQTIQDSIPLGTACKLFNLSQKTAPTPATIEADKEVQAALSIFR